MSNTKHTIRTRDHGDITYFIGTSEPGESRHVYVDTNGLPGVLGDPAGYYDKRIGAVNTLQATPETLKDVAERHRKRMTRRRREQEK